MPGIRVHNFFTVSLMLACFRPREIVRKRNSIEQGGGMSPPPVRATLRSRFCPGDISLSDGPSTLSFPSRRKRESQRKNRPYSNLFLKMLVSNDSIQIRWSSQNERARLLFALRKERGRRKILEDSRIYEGLLKTKTFLVSCNMPSRRLPLLSPTMYIGSLLTL